MKRNLLRSLLTAFILSFLLAGCSRVGQNQPTNTDVSEDVSQNTERTAPDLDSSGTRETEQTDVCLPVVYMTTDISTELRIVRENEPVSLFNIRMNDEERWFKNSSGLDAEGLCRAYAECGRPFVEMGKYGEPIGIEDFAYIEQGDKLDFSIEFNDETGKISIFDGAEFTSRGMRETLFLKRMEDEPDAAVELAVKIDCLSYGNDTVLYHERVESMEGEVRPTAFFPFL